MTKIYTYAWNYRARDDMNITLAIQKIGSRSEAQQQCTQYHLLSTQ